jgi:acyl-CoA thioesterase I
MGWLGPCQGCRRTEETPREEGPAISGEHVHVCCIGDSHLQGHGDSGLLGWAGRLAVRALAEGVPLTYSNLGVRRETTPQVAARFEAEVAVRTAIAGHHLVVLSCGANDAIVVRGVRGTALPDSVAALTAMLACCERRGWLPFVVGPPLVGHPAQNPGIAEVSEVFRDVCTATGTPFADLVTTLGRDWADSLRRGGTHPDDAGYAHVADVVWPLWWAWLQDVRHGSPSRRAERSG